MNDRRRPSVLKVETRGVDTDGNGKNDFEVTVIVEGVRVVSVGEGGNTNKVSVGVGRIVDMGLGLGCAFGGERMYAGGISGLRDSRRLRGGIGWIGDTATTGGSLTGVTGDGGTGGRRPSGGGRRRVLAFATGRGVTSKDDLVAVAGSGGSLKVDLCAGAEGGILTGGVRRPAEDDNAI